MYTVAGHGWMFITRHFGLIKKYWQMLIHAGRLYFINLAPFSLKTGSVGNRIILRKNTVYESCIKHRAPFFYAITLAHASNPQPSRTRLILCHLFIRWGSTETVGITIFFLYIKMCSLVLQSVCVSGLEKYFSFLSQLHAYFSIK